MIKPLNYYWRLFATGLCFLCFGIGALLISTIIFPLQRLLIKDFYKRKKTARYTIHKSFKFFLTLMESLNVIAIKLENIESLKKISGHIIIANHPSLIDVIAIIAYIPNADCIIKAQLLKNPFLRGVLTHVGYLNNNDPEQLFEDCKKSLAGGSNIVIFPEGTRTGKDGEIKFKRGAANIALRCKANFIPILIFVKPNTLSKKELWYNIPPKKVVVSLHVQQQLSLSEYFERENLTLSVRSLTKEIEQYFCKELKNG